MLFIVYCFFVICWKLLQANVKSFATRNGVNKMNSELKISAQHRTVFSISIVTTLYHP